MTHKHITTDWSKSFMYGIHKTHFLIHKRLEQKLEKAKSITFSQFIIFVGLNCASSQTPSQVEIAEFLNMTEATMSRHIASLARSGYLVRKIDPTNKRRYTLTTTARGKKAFEKTQKIVEKELDFIFAVIPTKDRAVISRTFEKVLTQLLP